jgi:hypothetical protein
VAPSSGWRMSAFPPLSEDKQTTGECAKNDASDPKATSATTRPPDALENVSFADCYGSAKR